MPDLTTLARVKAHLAMAGVADADLGILSTILTSESAGVEREVGRPVLSAPVTEVRDGDGSRSLFLAQVPASVDTPPVTVTSVTVDGTAIPARPAVTALDTNPSGWLYRDGAVDLVGYTFAKGTANVTIVYRVGYQDTLTSTVPAAPGPYEVQAPEPWRSDVGVTINAVAATKVASAPAAGQYAVSSTGLYTFAAADTGKAVVLTFGVCPQDLEQALIERIALTYSDRQRIGLASQSVQAESATFGSAGILAYFEGVLDRYRAIGVG